MQYSIRYHWWGLDLPDIQLRVHWGNYDRWHMYRRRYPNSTWPVYYVLLVVMVRTEKVQKWAIIKEIVLILSCENSCQRQSNVVQLHFTALYCVHARRWNGDGINYLCRLPRSTSHLHRCTFKRKKYRALITQQNETNTRRWILTTAFHFLISKRGALPAAAAFFFDASSTAAGAASAISTSSVLFSVLPAIVTTKGWWDKVLETALFLFPPKGDGGPWAQRSIKERLS